MCIIYIYHINVVQRSLWQNKYIYLLSITFRFKLKHHKIIQNICTCKYTTKLPKNGPNKIHAVPQAAKKKNTINLSTQWFSEDSEIFFIKKNLHLVRKYHPPLAGVPNRGDASRSALLHLSNFQFLKPWNRVDRHLDPFRPRLGMWYRNIWVGFGWNGFKTLNLYIYQIKHLICGFCCWNIIHK